MITRVIVWSLVIVLAVYAFAVTWIWMPRGVPFEAKVMVEIDQLQTALHFYEEKRGHFPPCLGDTDPQRRKARFVRHLRQIFHEADFSGDALVIFEQINERVRNGFGDGKPGYNYRAETNGEIRPLDLSTLDVAESLVFWLGGFPTPCNSATGTSVANRKLFGFHRDQEDPLHRDNARHEGADPLRYRTEQFYQFDEFRLTDNDDDGWLEYSPRQVIKGEVGAPFVYFDAECYKNSSTDAVLLGGVCYPMGGVLAETWGVAAPLLKSFDPAKPTEAVWQNADGFQIVCGGLDNRYSAAVQSPPAVRRVVTYPEGKVFVSREWKTFEVEQLSEEEKDNLTNIGNMTLEAAAQNYAGQTVH